MSADLPSPFSAAPAGGFRVRPTELAVAGQAARATAERLRAGAAARPAAGDTAADALPGWRTAGALRDCAAAWQQTLARLAAELDGIGGDLLSTSGNYRETEAQLHRSLLPGH
ncbi:hypothetical protein [Kitasatospora sp. MAP5-34]|uniref:hypothetical protein n=1 Tax=Kitasatospora sp. MAP5-34 TaxID=3035102 RepID=UPI002475401F|nr:hypothetical protein [Kitasatospora sp. MAP5-34]MDH6579618.1 hypothetical protein [Kitasatospora sp. MAP5-34]